MDQVRTIPAAAPAHPPKRSWRRFSLVIQQVEQKPAKLFSIDSGPYSFRINVAMTAKVMHRIGLLLTGLLAFSHPVLWKAILYVARLLAQP